MAVATMGGDEKNPTFHDFLGMSSDDGEMKTDASVGLPSEGLGADNSEVFPFHGRKNIISELEAANTFSGRKRSISSSYMSLVRDKMLSVGSDSQENSCLIKAFGKEEVSEHIGKSHDDEPYTMQPPPRPSSSLLLHPPRPDSVIPKWDHSLLMNPISVVHCSSRLGQSGTPMEKISSSYTYKDVKAGATIITQAAADEGSRTGMKGSGILNIFNSSSSGAGERNLTGALPYSSRPKASQMVEPKSSSVPSRQMTIFYAGQAHVFDDVHPNKADVIMALAGSSGVSWSTNCSPKPGICPPGSKTKAPSGDNDFPVSNYQLSIPGFPDRGLIAQAAQTPPTNDLQSLPPGGRVTRDPRLMTSAAEPGIDGKRDA